MKKDEIIEWLDKYNKEEIENIIREEKPYLFERDLFEEVYYILVKMGIISTEDM